MKRHITIFIFLLGSYVNSVSANIPSEIEVFAFDPQETGELIKLNVAEDEAILKAMDKLGVQLDIIELDKQYNDNSDHIDALKETNETDRLNETNILIDDGFDDLDLDEALIENNEPLVLDEFDLIEDKITSDVKTKNSNLQPKKGVGVIGEEELIINQLDNSGLIDIEPELDLLLDKLPTSVEKIDEFE